MDLQIGTKQTFVVSRLPQREAQRKTIRRLMRMQPEIQRGLSALSGRRRRKDNVTYQRAGRQWTHRAKMTKLTRVAEGETFTITITPQIVPDINSVAAFLQIK